MSILSTHLKTSGPSSWCSALQTAIRANKTAAHSCKISFEIVFYAQFKVEFLNGLKRQRKNRENLKVWTRLKKKIQLLKFSYSLSFVIWLNSNRIESGYSIQNGNLVAHIIDFDFWILNYESKMFTFGRIQ